MNILYICSPHVTDIKWMSYFSQDKSNTVYMTTVKPSDIYLTDSFKKHLQHHHIQLIDVLDSYSLSSPSTILKNIKRLNQQIKELKIDLLHVMFSSPYALWINHVKIPSVITNRGSDILIVIPELSKGKGIKEKIHYRLTASAFRKANCITGTSSKTVLAVKEQFKKQAHLVRTGIKVKEIGETFLSDTMLPELLNKKIIFFPRSILPLYRTDMQIESIKLLPDNIRDSYIFVFVRGMIENKTFQQNIINQLNEINNLNYKIYETLTQAEMAAIYNGASLTISTPKSDGTPNSALEAMAASCPLIMGAIDLDNDLFNENICLKLKEDTADELSKSIVNAIENYPSEKLQMALENVKQNADWENEMTKLNNLYSQIIKH
jgi:glycosyltransferase involved in cell wall biosynthesis